jgi:hypothetical protein
MAVDFFGTYHRVNLPGFILMFSMCLDVHQAKREFKLTPSCDQIQTKMDFNPILPCIIVCKRNRHSRDALIHSFINSKVWAAWAGVKF